MQATATVTIGAIGVRQQLAALGLIPDNFNTAIAFGEKHRALCTLNDPRIFHGTTAWARTLRGLRQELHNENWKKDHTGNFETVVSPDETLAISVATGDRETGKYNPPHEPRLKHPKGIMYKAAIDTNAWLFKDLAADAKAKTDKLEAAQKRITWILLIRREGDTVFSELSLARQFSDGGQVEHWEHRIILEPLDVEPLDAVIDDSGDDDAAAETIDVPVSRR